MDRDTPPGATLFDCAAPGRVYGQTVRAQLPGLVLFREPPFEDCEGDLPASTFTGSSDTRRLAVRLDQWRWRIE